MMKCNPVGAFLLRAASSLGLNEEAQWGKVRDYSRIHLKSGS
jgi:hypothetical protein